MADVGGGMKTHVFSGTVQPVTGWQERGDFRYKLVLADGRQYYLAAEPRHCLRFKMDIWEEFRIVGVLLSNDVIAVKKSQAVVPDGAPFAGNFLQRPA